VDDVRCGHLFWEHARELFPPGGNAGGAPSLELFRVGPLRAAIEFFRRQFDEAPEAAAGIKVWVTIAPPWFPPLVFYAARVADHIELLDVTSEDPQEYWAMIESDPRD
jgi:hypothetical protein